MRPTRIVFGLAAACLAFTPVYADSHGPAAQHGSKPTTTGKPAIVAKPTTSGKPLTTGKPGGTTSKVSGPKSSSTTPTPTTSRSTTTTGPKTATLNPIAQKISSKPQLLSRVTTMLPKGMKLNDASAGFKNQGQFLAALHVSENLGISFKSLKNDMTRKNLSLGQSIQDLKKSADPATEAKLAQTEANDDLKTTTSKIAEPVSTSPTTLNPIAQKISSKPQLLAKITVMLPTGMKLNDASAGFKNQGQFIAALHVSQNLGISFKALKKDMVKNNMSLGQAIQDVKRSANTTLEVQKAQTQADADLAAPTPVISPTKKSSR